MGGRRRAALVLVGLALLGTACTGAGKQTSAGEVDEEDVVPVGAQTYTVNVDVPSPEGQKLQASVFLPVSLSVMPGDTIVFENRSTEAPHTVTFIPKEAAAEPYPVMTKAGAPNPLVFGPCYSAAAPAADAEACPEAPPAPPPAYAGTGFWNSGVIAPTTAAGAPHSVTLAVAPNIEPGMYSYTCALHPNMTGGIDVVPSPDLRRSPAAAAKKAQRQRTAVLSGAAKVVEPPVNAAIVNAGWGDATFAVNKFSPADVQVKAGQTVTWKATGFEPHTITFDSPFKMPEDAGALTPGGAKTGARYSGGFAHSGLVGPAPRFAGDTFSLVFTKPGTYSYVCVLHPGMAGQVVVTG